LNSNDESFSLPINSLINQKQFGVSEVYESIAKQRTNLEKLKTTANREEYPSYYPQSMFTISPTIQQVVEPSPFVQERSSYKDTLKSSLNDQLSQAWKIIRCQKVEQRNTTEQTIDTSLNTDFDVNSESEIIFVNVWKNVDGKLKLAGQKPMLKEKFDEMQRKKDFSKLATQL
jgi:hypothetical protein